MSIAQASSSRVQLNRSATPFLFRGIWGCRFKSDPLCYCQKTKLVINQLLAIIHASVKGRMVEVICDELDMAGNEIVSIAFLFHKYHNNKVHVIIDE